MIERIMVPVDGSALAEAALTVALAVAERSGADIHLALVRSGEDREPQHLAYLERTAESVRALAGSETSVSFALLDGDVAQALCEEAGSTPGLIVMGSHGHGGLARAWLGSVTEAVLRGHPGPVVVVKPESDAPDEPLEARVVHHIMVPVDGTLFSETAVEPALELARLLGARLTIFQTVPSSLAFEYLIDTAEILERKATEARAYVESIRSRFDDGSCGIDVAVGVHRSAAEGVLEFADRNAVDFTVLASHLPQGVARTLLGSVADKILRGSPAPVMVVHPHAEEVQQAAEHPQAAEPPPAEVASIPRDERSVHAAPDRYRNVMLSLDGSPTSEHAIPLAATIAQRAGATLHVVTVVEPSGQTQDAEQYLESVVGKIQDEYGCQTTASVRSGLPALDLREHVLTCEADVTVMATHGRSGVSRAWLGSVATDFLSETERPVVLVRPEEGGGGTAPEAASGFTRILVPLDGSAFSEKCLEGAVVLGHLFDATYHLTRVVLLPDEIPARYFDRDRAEAKVYLEEHAERLRQRGLTASTSALLDRRAGPVILEVGVAEECDSIAMATSARRGLRRALFGSTADKVLRGGRVPMLLYGPRAR